VLVAASLQTLSDRGRPKDQLWAKKGTPLIDALRASLAVPPIFGPVRVTGDDLQHWLEPNVIADPSNWKQCARGIDLVDGSVIRQNPLPALYGFLRHSSFAEAMATNNDGAHPAIHVVYGVPIEGRPWPRNSHGRPDDGERGFRNTIVDV